MKQNSDQAPATRVPSVNSPECRPGLNPEYVILEVVDIMNSALFGSEKAFAMLEQLDIPIEYRAKVAILMRLFEEIEKGARQIFDAHPWKRKTVEV